MIGPRGDFAEDWLVPWPLGLPSAMALIAPDLSGARSLMVIAGSGYDARRRKNNRVLHTETSLDVVARIGSYTSALGDELNDWMEMPAVSLCSFETT